MAVSQFKATTADLLASIKNRALIPTSQETFTDEDLLQMADEELLTSLVPLILSTQEDYYTSWKDYPVDGKEYEISSRALGGKLRDVVCVNETGDEYSVPRVNPEDAEYSDEFSFFLRANRVIFTELPKDPVRVYFHIRPNCLIKSMNCGVVTAIDTDLRTVEISTIPSNFTAASIYDVVSPKAPFQCRAIDLTPTDITDSVLTFDVLPTVSLGDYLCLAGQSPVVQLPYDLIPVLAQSVAVKVLEGNGDRDGMAAAQARLDTMGRNAFKLLEPRVDGQPSKVINYQSSLRYFNRYRRYF